MNIVIIGKSTHSDYAEALHLACIVAENHALFSYKAFSHCPRRYKRILRIFNGIYKWEHVDPVLIFREQGFQGGPVEYIGNIDQFHEFIFEYYGERRAINKCEAEKSIEPLSKEKRFHRYIRRTEKSFKRYTHVSIIGAGYNIEATEFLVYQLIKLKEIHNKDGIKIRLYDFDKCKQIELLNVIQRIRFIEELIEPFTPITIVEKIENAIKTCDFLFLTGDIQRNEKLTTYETVKINQYVFSLIGQVVDVWASPDIKIILMNMDHLCFNANVLTDNMSKVPSSNVVCITQHLGIEPVGYISLATGIPALHINNGYVWGFIGFSHLIDMKEATVLYNQFDFNERGSKLNFSKTKINQKYYPYKIVENCWLERPLTSVINNMEYMWYYVGTRKEYIRKVTGNSNYVSNVRMALELVRIWKCGLKENACICVGVPSDKTYGFPRHMFISQPVKLVNDKWIPFANLPIPDDIIDFEDIVLLASSILRLCKIGTSITPKCKWLRDTRPKKRKLEVYEAMTDQILYGLPTDALLGPVDEGEFVYNDDDMDEEGNLSQAIYDYFSGENEFAGEFGERSEDKDYRLYLDDIDFDQIRRERLGGEGAEGVEEEVEEEEVPLKKKKKVALSSSEESLSINTVDTEEDDPETMFQETFAAYTLDLIEGILYHPQKPLENDEYNVVQIYYDLLKRRNGDEKESEPTSSTDTSKQFGYTSKHATLKLLTEFDEISFNLDDNDVKAVEKEPQKEIKNIRESNFEIPPYAIFYPPERYSVHETDDLYKARIRMNMLDLISNKEKYALRNEDIEYLSDSISINPDLSEDVEELEEELYEEEYHSSDSEYS